MKVINFTDLRKHRNSCAKDVARYLSGKGQRERTVFDLYLFLLL